MPADTLNGTDAPVEASKSSDTKSALLSKPEEVFSQAADSAKKLMQHYKDGGKTGITTDFGKPVIVDSSKDQGITPADKDFAASALEACPKPQIAKITETADKTTTDTPNGDHKTDFKHGQIKSQESKKDGTTVTVFKNGDVLTENPKEDVDVLVKKNGEKETRWNKEGITQTEYTNGDKLTVYKDGMVQMEYQEGSKTKETIFPNGDRQTEYRNGDRVDEAANGTKMTVKEDGSWTLENKDHTFKSVHNKDGSVELYDNGTRTIFKDGVKTVDYPNGDRVVEDHGKSTITKADGTTIVTNPDGSVVMKDKNGKVLANGKSAD